MTDYVFVYGTLKNKLENDDCYIHGTLYNIGPFPGVKLDGDNRVPGQLISVEPDDLVRLDNYEGVPILYTRKRTCVYSIQDDSKMGSVWVYEFNREVDDYMEIEAW